MAKRKKKSGPRFEWIRNINWSNVRRSSIAAAWLIGAGCLIAAAMYGVPRLESRALAEMSVEPEEIEFAFVDPPAWFRGGLELRLVETARAQVYGDPLARTASNENYLADIRDALLNTGWFEQVAQVRRMNARRVEIDAAFADPAALIRNHEGDHLIDSRGRLLPQTFPEGEADHFMVIIGTHFDRPARPGLEWEGADVIAALDLLKVVEQQPWRSQVGIIDVTGQLNAAGTGTMKLITDRGSWLLWGSPPGDEAPMEADTKRKLQFLNHNYTSFQHIDGNHRGEVDITDDKRVINR